ncbi:alkaline phosphatase family protein (plasmid) [Nitrobacteraceae bacterium UC4446_H13]
MPKSVAERIVVVVFDGLRPDFVTSAFMPNLSAFCGRGTVFNNAKSVFPSLTRVATASLATGSGPRRHGAVGNGFYMPPILGDTLFDLTRLALLPQLERFDCSALAVPTFGEFLAAAGKRLALIHGGSPGATISWAPNADRCGHWFYSAHGDAGSLTPEVTVQMKARFGPDPGRMHPQFDVITRLSDIYIQHALKNVAADVTVIWFPEPDTTFHYRGLLSDDARKIMAHCDLHFGRIAAAIEKLHGLDNTLLIALSDHGHITANETVPLFDEMTNAGFAVSKSLADKPLFLGFRGSVGHLSLADPNHGGLAQAVEWLQSHPSVGHLFTQGRNRVDGVFPGTFSHQLVNLNHARAPDIVFTLRAYPDADKYGVSGWTRSMGEIADGGSLHGGLSQPKMSSFLAMRGMSAEAGGARDEVCGLIDIAPTMLSALGMPIPSSMQGRSLLDDRPEEGTTRTFSVENGAYHQSVTIHEAVNADYIMSGTTE